MDYSFLGYLMLIGTADEIRTLLSHGVAGFGYGSIDKMR
jgi:hypothetical protein